MPRLSFSYPEGRNLDSFLCGATIALSNLSGRYANETLEEINELKRETPNVHDPCGIRRLEGRNWVFEVIIKEAEAQKKANKWVMVEIKDFYEQLVEFVETNEQEHCETKDRRHAPRQDAESANHPSLRLSPRKRGAKAPKPFQGVRQLKSTPQAAGDNYKYLLVDKISKHAEAVRKASTFQEHKIKPWSLEDAQRQKEGQGRIAEQFNG
jgi:hypothetical protein